jgi:nicotinamidase-related amidase
MSADTRAIEAVDSFAQRPGVPAIVTIDLHRGHLDPSVATLPLHEEAASALMSRVLPILERARRMDLPVVHVTTLYQDREEILANPYWRYQSGRGGVRSSIADHQAPGSHLDLMPGVAQAGDVVVNTKRRYDSFVASDLDFVLRSRGCSTLFLMGVNTNSCVLATAIAASVRDYAVYVLSDGVDTMMGPDYHDAALRIIAGSFGWVVDADTMLSLVERQQGGT